MKALRNMSRRELALLAAALLVPIPAFAATGLGLSLPNPAPAGLASLVSGGRDTGVSTGDVAAGPASGGAASSPSGRSEGHVRLFGKRRAWSSRPKGVGGLGLFTQGSRRGRSSDATSPGSAGAGAEASGSGDSGASSGARGDGGGGTTPSGGGSPGSTPRGGGSPSAGDRSNGVLRVSANGQGTSADADGSRDGALITVGGPGGSGAEVTGGTAESGDGVSVDATSGDASSGTGVAPSTGVGLP